MSLHPQVLAAMAAVAARGGNPASLHQLGQAARRAVDAAAAQVAEAVGLAGAEVVFAASLAEAHALALLPAERPAGAGPVLLPASAGPWQGVADLLAAQDRACGRWSPQGAWPATAVPAAAAVLAVADFHPATGLSEQLWAGLAQAARAGVPVHLELAGPCLAKLAWPVTYPAGLAPQSVVLASEAIGGPWGLVALVAERAPVRAGTVPRELVVGLGEAARLACQMGHKQV